MNVSAEYDDTQLQQLFAELEPRRRQQAMKGAFRREATRVRRTAVNNLRASGIRTDRDLEKGIRSLVFKRKAGFRITVGTKRANKAGKGEKGYHLNRYGQMKPVLLWAETGTRERFKKGAKKGLLRRASKGASTGRMKRYAFMSKTLMDVKDTVTDDLHKEVAENIIRISKKYGCK